MSQSSHSFLPKKIILPEANEVFLFPFPTTGNLGVSTLTVGAQSSRFSSDSSAAR